ncbi:hypothetical protein BASA60_006275 [Batrachochytrium salamandrivorans]|nr:hypothetical protein BASA60_006275 [Batrachochytrium salamandrivorans]
MASETLQLRKIGTEAVCLPSQDVINKKDADDPTALRLIQSSLTSRTHSSCASLYLATTRSLTTRPNQIRKHLRSNTLADLRTETISKECVVSRSNRAGPTPLVMESEMKLRILNTIVGNGPKLECDKNTKIKESQCIRKKGHRAALSITGAQRTLLEAKYTQLRDEFLKNVQKVGHSISSQVQEALEEFKIDWEKSSNDDSIGIEILTTKRLSQLSLDEFMAIKDNIIKAFDFRNERLDSLEGKLTDLERDRSNQLELHLTGFSRQFKKLNYEPPEGIARIAQEECQSANLAIVENRESIHRCIAILRSVNIDVDTRMNKHLKHSSDNWNQARYDFVYETFSQTIDRELDLNISTLYANFHVMFQKSVDEQSMLMTCIQMANIEFVAETKPYCKTAEINAGKRLGTSLSSQASRNRDVMNKVAEFIVCLLSLKAETADRIIKAEFDTVTKVHEMSIKLTAEQNVYETNLGKELQTMRIETHESSIVKRLVKCKELLSSINGCLHETFVQSSSAIDGLGDKIHDIERIYNDRITSMFSIDESLIDCTQLPKAQCITEGLNGDCTQIQANDKWIPKASMSYMNAQPGRVSVSHVEAVDTLQEKIEAGQATDCALSHPGSLDKNESGASPLEYGDLGPSRLEAPCTPQPTSTKDLWVYELGFLSKKVAEWRQEQQQQKLKAWQIQLDAESLAAKAKKHQSTMKLSKKSGCESMKQGSKSANCIQLGLVDPHSTTTGVNTNKAAETLQPLFKPTLLDSSECSLQYNVISFITFCGFSPDFSHTVNLCDASNHLHSSNDKSDAADSVEIPHIPNQILSELRLYLKESVIEDYARWKISINEAVSQRITSKIEKLASVRHLQIIEYEKRLHYMIDVAQGRIDSLKHLRTTHENEACLILNRVKKVQARYASEIDQLINSSHEFSAKVISPLTSRLNKASSQSAVSRIQYEVQDAIKQHTTTLKQCLFTAISDFDDGKAVLIKSQLVGHHSAAWQIMGEACLIDSESFAHEMDRWRDTFDARIEDVQAKTEDHVHWTNLEFVAYMEDLGFIHQVDSRLASHRIKLKSEWIRYKSEHKKLQTQLNSLSHLREALRPNWDNIQQYIAECRNIQTRVIECAHYLGCLVDRVTPQTLCIPPSQTLEEWKALKHGHTDREMKLASRPNSSKKTFDSKAASLADLESTFISKDILEPNAETLTMPRGMRDSLNNTTACQLATLQYLSDDTNIKKDGVEDLSSQATSDGRFIQSVKARYENPQRQSIPSRSALGSASSSGFSDTASRKGNRNGATCLPRRSARGSTYSDSYPILDSNEVSFSSEWDQKKMQIRNGHASNAHIGLDTYLQFQSRCCTETKGDILAHCETYYTRRSEKDIRKKDKIPPSFAQYMELINTTLAKIEKQAEKQRKNQVKARDADEALIRAWRECTIRFSQKRTDIYKSKEEHTRQLKSSLGHPRWTVELGKLDGDAQTTCSDYETCIEELQNSCGKRLQSLSIDFTERLEYVTYLLAAIFNGLVIMGEDVQDLEVDEEISSTILKEGIGLESDLSEVDGQRLQRLDPTQTSDVSDLCQNEPRGSQMANTSFNEPRRKKTWAACPIHEFPFSAQSIETFSSHILESRSTEFHRDLISSRDITFNRFVVEINRRMHLLNEHTRVERVAEKQWHSQWQENISRIKASY